MITGINHITIAVTDLQRSLEFYIETLGFTGHAKWNDGAYLSIGDLWYCLSCDEVCPKKDYTHVAFDVSLDNFTVLCSRVKSYGVKQWKENKSEGNSLYLLDPDGHKLEIHAGDLKSRLESLRHKPYKGLVWL